MASGRTVSEWERSMSRYGDYPDHPLCRINQTVLDVARKVLDDAVEDNDVEERLAHPIADAVVLELVNAGYFADHAFVGGTA